MFMQHFESKNACNGTWAQYCISLFLLYKLQKRAWIYNQLNYNRRQNCMYMNCNLPWPPRVPLRGSCTCSRDRGMVYNLHNTTFRGRWGPKNCLVTVEILYKQYRGSVQFRSYRSNLSQLEKLGNIFLQGIFWIFLFLNVIQHCFICRPSDPTVSKDAGIEPRTVAIFGMDHWTPRRSDHSAYEIGTDMWCTTRKTFLKKGAIRRNFVVNKYIPALNMNFVKNLCRLLLSKTFQNKTSRNWKSYPALLYRSSSDPLQRAMPLWNAILILVFCTIL